MDRDEVEVHKHAKKERGQYPAILTEQTWSIKDLLYGFWGNFACGIQRVVPSGRSILPARVANHSARFGFILPARGTSHIINCIIDLRQPIPKRSRCKGHIVISWMFTGVVKQALFAKISSISVSHPLNFKHFLWHVIFLLQDTGGIT